MMTIETIEEFTNLLEVHGADPARWPHELRDSCESFIANDSTAIVLLAQYRELEQLLGRVPVPEFDGLEARVLNQELPAHNASSIDKLLEWLLPAGGLAHHLWRPAMVACLPLLFGIVLGNFYSFGVGFDGDEFEYWEDELAMLSLDDYTESSF
jgi:hypothetical protein